MFSQIKHYKDRRTHFKIHKKRQYEQKHLFSLETNIFEKQTCFCKMKRSELQKYFQDENGSSERNVIILQKEALILDDSGRINLNKEKGTSQT